MPLGLVLVRHLEEQQEHQLGDVLAVGDAVVAQDVAEVPEFLDDVVGGSWFVFEWPVGDRDSSVGGEQSGGFRRWPEQADI